MTQSSGSDEAPLDAAQARVVQRLRRLMVFSSLIMIGGILLVFGVIAYRLSGVDVPAEPAEANVNLPQGARVISTAVADGRLVVTIEHAGSVEVRLFDLSTLESRGRIRFGAAP